MSRTKETARAKRSITAKKSKKAPKAASGVKAARRWRPGTVALRAVLPEPLQLSVKEAQQSSEKTRRRTPCRVGYSPQTVQSASSLACSPHRLRSVISTLLVIGGVEQNPGPPHFSTEELLSVLDQFGKSYRETIVTALSGLNARQAQADAGQPMELRYSYGGTPQGAQWSPLYIPVPPSQYSVPQATPPAPTPQAAAPDQGARAHHHQGGGLQHNNPPSVAITAADHVGIQHAENRGRYDHSDRQWHGSPDRRGYRDAAQNRGRGGGRGAGRGRGSDAGRGRGSDVGRGRGSDVGRGRGSDAGRGRGSDAGRGRGSDASRGRGSDASRGRGSDAGRGRGSDAGRGRGSDVGRGRGSDASHGRGRGRGRGQGRENSQNRRDDNRSGGNNGNNSVNNNNNNNNSNNRSAVENGANTTPPTNNQQQRKPNNGAGEPSPRPRSLEDEHRAQQKKHHTLRTLLKYDGVIYVRPEGEDDQWFSRTMRLLTQEKQRATAVESAQRANQKGKKQKRSVDQGAAVQPADASPSTPPSTPAVVAPAGDTSASAPPTAGAATAPAAKSPQRHEEPAGEDALLSASLPSSFADTVPPLPATEPQVQADDLTPGVFHLPPNYQLSEEWKQKAAETQSLLERLSTEKSALARDLSRVRLDLQAEKDKSRQLEARLHSVEQEHTDAVDQLNSEKDELEHTLSAKALEVRNERAKCRKLEEQLQSLLRERNASDSRHESNIFEVQQQLADQSLALQKANGALAAVRTRSAQQEAALTNLRSRVKELQSQLEDVESQLVVAQVAKDDAEARCASLTKEADSFRNERLGSTSLSARVTILEAAVKRRDDLIRERDDLITQVVQMIPAVLQQLADESRAISSEGNKDLLKSLNDTLHRAAQLDIQLANERHSRALTEGTAEALRTEAQLIRASRDSLAQKMGAFHQELREALTKSGALEGMNRQLQLELQEAHGDAERAIASCKLLTVQCSDAAAVNVALQAEVSRASSDKKRLAVVVEEVQQAVVAKSSPDYIAAMSAVVYYSQRLDEFSRVNMPDDNVRALRYVKTLLMSLVMSLPQQQQQEVWEKFKQLLQDGVKDLTITTIEEVVEDASLLQLPPPFPLLTIAAPPARLCITAAPQPPSAPEPGCGVAEGAPTVYANPGEPMGAQ